MSETYTQIYKIVCRIPKGRVLTYGLISNMIGGRMSAQGVGWALRALGSKTRKKNSKNEGGVKEHFTSDSVPWQRVVNAHGGTSTHKVGLPPDLQRVMLEKEGIVFDAEGKIDLSKYLWMEGLDSEDS